jgi:hypothetical protein
MSVNDAGFLSPEIDQHRDRILAKWSKQFELCGRVSRCCHAQKFKFTVHPENRQEVLAIGAFLKLLGDAEGSVILFERGLYSQGCSLLRVAIECSITIAKICNDTDFARAFDYVGEAERLKLLQRIKTADHPGFDSLREDIPEGLIKELEESVRGEPRKIVEQWANDVGMGQIYDVQYRLFCTDVHTGPYSLERFFHIDQQARIRGIVWGPLIEEECRPHLMEIARLLLDGLERVAKVFGVNVERELQPLLQEYDSLNKELAALKQPS